MNNKELAHRWANDPTLRAKANNMFCENGAIYSYGHHFCIANHYLGEIVLFTTESYSATTAKHKGYVLNAISHKNVIQVPNVQPRKEADHVSNTNYLIEKAKEQKEKVLRSKKKAMLELETFRADLKGLFRYANAFMSPSYNEAMAYYNENHFTDEQLDNFKKQETIVIERENKKARENLAKWRNGENCSMRSFYDLPIALRLRGKTIETSHGAKVPLSDAIRLYMDFQQNKQVIGQDIGNYTITCANTETVKIGCHTIDYCEIDRLIRSVLKEKVNK